MVGATRPTHKYILIYTYTYIHIYTDGDFRDRFGATRPTIICTYMHSYIYTFMPFSIYACMHIYIHPCIHIYTYIDIHTHIHIHTYIHTYIHILGIAPLNKFYKPTSQNKLMEVDDFHAPKSKLSIAKGAQVSLSLYEHTHRQTHKATLSIANGAQVSLSLHTHTHSLTQ